jgi:hypothetical protein
MDIHFNHTEPVDAPAETLFEVITDDAGYPRFNPAVVKMTVVAKDEDGAEFIAKRKTRIAKQVRAFRPLRTMPATPPYHRRVDHHATRARPRDETPPSAVVPRHQLQSIHPRGAAAQTRQDVRQVAPRHLILNAGHPDLMRLQPCRPQR